MFIFFGKYEIIIVENNKGVKLLKTSDDNKLSTIEKEDYAKLFEKYIYYTINTFVKNRNTVDLDELYSIGCVEFTKALNTYDKSKKTKFNTYVIQCIKNGIFLYLKKENRNKKRTTSLNKIIYEDERGTKTELQDNLKNTDKNAEEQFLSFESNCIVLNLVNGLPRKEKYILIYLLGLKDGEIKTQSQIAKTLKMTQANVSKLYIRALAKIEYALDLMEEKIATLSEIIEDMNNINIRKLRQYIYKLNNREDRKWSKKPRKV